MTNSGTSSAAKKTSPSKKKTTTPKTSPSDMAKALLDMHVAHELEQLEEENFLKICEAEADYLFNTLQDTTISSLVSESHVNEVILNNVVEARIPGAIAEIAGEAASALFNAKFHKETKLKDILSKASYTEFIDKCLELKEQRKQGIDKIIDLPIYADLISGILYQAIVRYIYDSNLLSKNIPGVSSILKIGRNAVNKAAPKLGSGFEDGVRGYIVDSLDLIISESKAFLEENVSDEQLKASAIELWEQVENKKLKELQQGMSNLDLSEFVSLGYDFWQGFRKSVYFKNSYEAIVSYFYGKYGDQKVAVLLDDLNITPERAIEHIKIFAPQALSTLRELGVLEQIIRRHHERFYMSDKVNTLLNK